MLYRGVVVVQEVKTARRLCPAAGCQLYAFEQLNNSRAPKLEAFGEEWQREQPLEQG